MGSGSEGGRTPPARGAHWWVRWSLDSPVAALGWLTLSWSAEGRLPPLRAVAVLFASTWLVYSADRWLDGWRLRDSSVALPTRHDFPKDRWRGRALLWLGVLIFDLVAAFALDARVLHRGVVLLAVVGGYLFVVHQRPVRLSQIPKEVLVAAVFTSGVLLFAPLAAEPARGWRLEALGLFGVSWLNCQIVSWWDREYDVTTGQATWLGGLGQQPLFVGWGCSLVVGFGILARLGAVRPPWGLAVAFAAVGLVGLALLSRRSSRRSWVDLVLAAPAWAFSLAVLR